MEKVSNINTFILWTKLWTRTIRCQLDMLAFFVSLKLVKGVIIYDKVIVDKNPIYWKGIIVIYAVIVINRDGMQL